MDKKFNEIFDFILLVEGGYSNHPLDKGGKTKYGIIEREARKHGYSGDMRDLSKEIAKSIYYKDYYLINKLDKVDSSKIALSICDIAVNCGNKTACKKVQQVLNDISDCQLTVDGIIGQKTLKALNKIDESKFLSAYHKAQADYYRAIVSRKPNQSVFLKGWLNRIARKEKFLEKKY
ncbi:glycoside hydrolase family 108 protein [Caviibacter abscessus]|uniref:glycoside hydrolase family 108 protein n=1 Tax=Caviibacter abscessus TaxID=1766719 RepID=UPI000837B32F|nr:N-acetylmuramidase [Caviibacter abscessus]